MARSSTCRNPPYVCKPRTWTRPVENPDLLLQVQATRFQTLLLADVHTVYGMLEKLAALCKPDGNARVRENARAALTAVLDAVCARSDLCLGPLRT